MLPVRELSLLPGETSKMLNRGFSVLVKPVSNTDNASGSRVLVFKGTEKK